jgi:hypothetical protein
MTTALCNPHFVQSTEAESPAMPRLREVTNSPEMEYAARPGEVERLADSMAALILFRKRFAEVGREEIKFTENKQLYKFFSPDSITCGLPSGTKVHIVFNRHDMTCVHVMTKEGRYVETLPAKSSAEILNPEDASRELAAHGRMAARTLDRVRVLHESDTLAAVMRARQNEEDIQRVVATLPAEADPAAGAPASSFPEADRLAEAVAEQTRIRSQTRIRREALRGFRPADLTDATDTSDALAEASRDFDAAKLL